MAVNTDAGTLLPLTGAADTVPSPPDTTSDQTTSAPAQAGVSAPKQAAAVGSSDGGLDSTLVLIAVGVISIPLLLVMALVATVLTRR